MLSLPVVILSAADIERHITKCGVVAAATLKKTTMQSHRRVLRESVAFYGFDGNFFSCQNGRKDRWRRCHGGRSKAMGAGRNHLMFPSRTRAICLRKCARWIRTNRNVTGNALASDQRVFRRSLLGFSCAPATQRIVRRTARPNEFIRDRRFQFHADTGNHHSRLQIHRRSFGGGRSTRDGRQHGCL